MNGTSRRNSIIVLMALGIRLLKIRGKIKDIFVRSINELGQCDEHNAVRGLGTTLLEHFDLGACLLTQFLDLGALLANDGPGMRLVNQHTHIDLLTSLVL